jgi:MFS family permease
LADHLGRRKPVLIAGSVVMLASALAILYMPPSILPAYLGGFILGFGSGAAMIPYTIIKEVNPDNVKGSATGAINFLVFTLSALAAPAYGWLLTSISHGATLTLPAFQKAGVAGIVGIIVAIILSCFIKETGSAIKKQPSNLNSPAIPDSIAIVGH